MNQSGLSSSLLLQNTWSPSHPRRQSIPLALAVGRELLAETGAIRVHGGGFAGTIQAFVPFDILDSFVAGMDAALGQGACHVLSIRPQGGVPAVPADNA
jgi:galactokinase